MGGESSREGEGACDGAYGRRGNMGVYIPKTDDIIPTHTHLFKIMVKLWQ